MKGLIKKISVRLFACLLYTTVFLASIVTTKTIVLADDYNWVQWYELYGMGTVVGEIMKGNVTPIEACDKVIIPAYKEGKVEQKHLNAFIRDYPEIESYLINNGVISGGVTDNTVTSTPTPKPTPAVPEYTIEDCDMYKYATTDVNVRVEPSTNTNKVGNVPQNEKVHVTGKTSNGWYRLEYNGVTGFSLAKYFADKPIEVVENVTDVPEPTPAPTPEPTAEPTAEPAVTEAPAPEPTETPNNTKTEIVEPVKTEKPVETPEPTAEPTKAPTEAEITVEPTTEPVSDETEPTQAPVVADPVVTGPIEETNNLILWIALGGVVLVLGVVAVVVLKRRKK